MHFRSKILHIFAINNMDPAEKTTIEQRLVETGEKERLKEHLRTRLTESGWREELKLHAREVVRTRGLNNIKHEDLVKESTEAGDYHLNLDGDGNLSFEASVGQILLVGVVIIVDHADH